MNTSKEVRKRHAIQWALVPIVVITIGLGWKWPLLGFSVPIVMMAGMIGAMVNGRYVCGNLCPRGSFLDRTIPYISRKKAIPGILRNMILRWAVFAGLMGLMIFRIAQNVGNIYHWGKVFWLMCVVTSAIGIILGILIHPRSWCAFCPMGTMQNAIGGGKKQLKIDAEKCVECKKCEKVCPFDLEIVKHKKSGQLNDRDCLRCGECIWVCPKEAIE